MDAARKELGDVIVIEADAGDAAGQGKVAGEIRKAFGTTGGRGGVRPIVQHEREGSILSASGIVAGVREPSVDRNQRVGQSAHRDANIERLCSNEGGDDFVDENAFW